MATWPERWPNDHTSETSVLDRERDRLVARLRTDCTEGRISLDRFSDLVGDVYAARTRTDLEQLASSFPAPPRPVFEGEVASRGKQRLPKPPRKSGQWILAVFGSSVRKGRYRLEDNSTAAAVFGDCVVDLTDATIDDDEVAINAVSVFGSVTVIVPEGIDVQIEGAAIFGSRRCDVDAREVLSGSPVVVVRAWAVFGDVRVRTPRRSRR